MRIGAILRRASQVSIDQELTADKKHRIYNKEGLTVDFTAYRATIDGEEIRLSPKEYDLLFYMIRNHNIALTREQLISEVWGYDYYGDDRTLDTHIKLLRKSLGP